MRVVRSLFLRAMKLVAGEISEVSVPTYRITHPRKHIFVKTLYPAFFSCVIH